MFMKSLLTVSVCIAAILAIALVLPGEEGITAAGSARINIEGGYNADTAFTLPSGTEWTALSYITGTMGLEVTQGFFKSVRVFGRISLPHFRYFDTIKHCTNANKISGPAISSLIGSGANAFFRVTQVHKVSTPGGVVAITFKYFFYNNGKIVPRIIYSGPNGKYSFYIWCDLDLNGAPDDRMENIRPFGDRLGFFPTFTESAFADTWYKFLGEYKLRFFDKQGIENFTLYVKPRANDQATMHVLRAPDMTNYPNTIKVPSDFNTGQKINKIGFGGFTGHWAYGGYDLALYYELIIQARSGTIGPTLRFLYWPKRKIIFEVDRVDTIGSWLPTIVRCSKTWTLAKIFKRAGMAPTVTNSSTIADETDGWTEAELHAAMVANRNFQETVSRWSAYCLLASTDQGLGSPMGIMFDDSVDPDLVAREGCAVFYDNIGSNARRLFFAAHGLGHCLNLQHEDGDAWDNDSSSTDGTTIMNQAANLASGWCYYFSALSKQHLRHHSWVFVKPGEGSAPFGEIQDNHTNSQAAGW